MNMTSGVDGKGRILIGYWWSKDEPHLPKPTDFVDLSWDKTEWKAVLAYLQSCEVVNRYRGMSLCRVCGIWNGSSDQADEKYIFPSGLAHYIQHHGVRPPAEFVKHVLEKSK